MSEFLAFQESKLRNVVGKLELRKFWQCKFISEACSSVCSKLSFNDIQSLKTGIFGDVVDTSNFPDFWKTVGVASNLKVGDKSIQMNDLPFVEKPKFNQLRKYVDSNGLFCRRQPGFKL